MATSPVAGVVQRGAGYELLGHAVTFHPLQIHPDGHGACFLYNLPAAVLEGRVQRDWMVSEDGCLVLCLVTRPADELQQQQAAAQGNDSGRSDPATPSLPVGERKLQHPAA